MLKVTEQLASRRGTDAEFQAPYAAFCFCHPWIGKGVEGQCSGVSNGRSTLLEVDCTCLREMVNFLDLILCGT